ncbi:unnamed protein product [Linum trigynum]|uniref:Uncharacterized protein n=1 Tax=Linum trigynum TaxID=586398 RepID=A0AAV2DP10_9ROSI
MKRLRIDPSPSSLRFSLPILTASGFQGSQQYGLQICYHSTQQQEEVRRELPRKVQYPVVDLLVSGQLAQSESQNPTSFKSALLL